MNDKLKISKADIEKLLFKNNRNNDDDNDDDSSGGKGDNNFSIKRIKKLKQYNKTRKIIKNFSNKNNEQQQSLLIKNKKLLNIVKYLNLLDIENEEIKIKIFLAFCRESKWSLNTVYSYLGILRKCKILSSDSKFTAIKPIPQYFKGQMHFRVVSLENWKKFFIFLHKNITLYSIPVLISIYTALRTMEILQFTNNTLYELISQNEMINIIRKKTYTNNDNDDDVLYWKPVYTTFLNKFITFITENFYKQEYKLYTQFNVVLKLFTIGPKSLCNRIRYLYYCATGELAPRGVAIHSSRYMNAILMSAESDNIAVIQNFLQHKNFKTTLRYVNGDATRFRNQFNNIVNAKFSNEINMLKKTLTI